VGLAAIFQNRSLGGKAGGHARLGLRLAVKARGSDGITDLTPKMEAQVLQQRWRQGQ